ncbi:MAG TPA: Rieske 2Fe-2S domain-containing protein [Polyangiaceae bacterium]|nr:Rieske 2Fe-2S domain-containing protein [Polyangiaceae bacterium]
MTFVPVCPASAVREGTMGLFQVGKKSVLLVWPAGGELKAFRGRCPHADMPLTDATFDGQKVTCALHGWGFDCKTGKCVTHFVNNALHPYEVRVEGEEVLVDVGAVRGAGQAGTAPP